MKRLSLIVASVVGVALFAVIPAARAQIINDNGNKTTYIAADRTIDDDLYVTGNSIQIDGTVNGDVYAAGSDVTIRGTVNGDVFAAGQSVDIKGTVKGSVRAAGSSVQFSKANIGGSVSAFGQVVKVAEDVVIGGGLNAAGSSVTVEGSVARGIIGAGNQMTIGAAVGKNVEVSSSAVTLESRAKIAGDLRYESDSNVDKQGGAQVLGQIKHTTAAPSDHRNSAGAKAAGAAWVFLSLLLLGVIILRFGPSAATGTAGIVLARPGMSVLVGFAALILVPVAAIVALVTIVGIPLGILTFLAYGTAIYLAPLPVALAIVERLRGQATLSNKYALLAIGLLILTLVEYLPFIGSLVSFIAALVGLGSMALYLQMRTPHRHHPHPSHRKVA